MVLFAFKRSIRNYTSFDIIGNNKPIEKVEICRIPALFMKGDKDGLINDDDFRVMFSSWGSDFKKYRVLEDTDHADERSQTDLEVAVRFCERFYEKHIIKENNVV